MDYFLFWTCLGAFSRGKSPSPSLLSAGLRDALNHCKTFFLFYFCPMTTKVNDRFSVAFPLARFNQLLSRSLSFWFRNRTKDEYFNVNLIWLNTISLQNFLTYACRRWKTVESGTFSSFPRPKSTHKGQTKFGRQENDCCCTQTQQQKWETKSDDDDDRGMRWLSRLRIRRFWRLEETQWKKYESLGKRQL